MAGETRLGALLIWILALFLIFSTFGLLAHFQIFHVKNLLPSSCSFGQTIECASFSLHRDSIDLHLINRLKETMMVTGVSISRNKIPIGCEPFDEYSWISGEWLNLSVHCNFEDSAMVFGFKEKLYVDIEYYPPQSGPKFEKKLSGTVFAAYQNVTFG